MKVLVVIPARYASTRFPGKPLALLGGKPIVEHVWERTRAVRDVSRVVVATDDDRIMKAVEAFGGEAMMTSTAHRSGTDRCGEVLQRLENEGRVFDVVVNVQGDEPFVAPTQIEALVECFSREDVDIATLRTRIATLAELQSPNNVKVVAGADGCALYFSRQPIPYRRDDNPDAWLDHASYYKHVGIYAFRSQTLKEVCRLSPGVLEQCEKLEQLRWLEAGYAIWLKDTAHANVGIDTPDDLLQAERILSENAYKSE